MEPLCQEAPSSDFEAIKEVIEKELNAKFEEIFSEFEKKPLGSASIAQVHKAKLRKNGEIVAVKIQHRNIAIQCPSDIAIVKFATGVAEWIWPGVSLNWINTEFKKNINNEINFLFEAENAQKIKKLFEGDEKIVIPKVKKNFLKKIFF
jgi:aarF domain-containing kinase